VPQGAALPAQHHSRQPVLHVHHVGFVLDTPAIRPGEHYVSEIIAIAVLLNHT